MTLLDKILNQYPNVKTSVGEQVKIDSIMIDDNGSIQSHFFAPDKLHEMRSVSKVLIALAYGIALDRKMKVNDKPLSLDTKVYPILKDLIDIKPENVDKIKLWTIKTLLTYTAGYDSQMFSEKYIKDIAKKDYLSYCLNFDLPNNPNEKYVYNNAELFILSVFFQEAFKENIRDFIAREIFAPLGIIEFVWENYDKYCPGGTGLYITHDSLFKIGELILNKGLYNGKQIISKEYIKEMCSTQMKTPYAVKPNRVLPKEAVGYVMHISRDGYAFKDGTNGQYLIVNFKKNLLITILSSESEMNYILEVLRDLV